MMKYFVFVLISLILLTSGVVYSHEINSKLVGKVIVLDAGHGGNDPGASDNGIIEKEYTLKISQYIYDRLRQLGLDVKMTWTED